MLDAVLQQDQSQVDRQETFGRGGSNQYYRMLAKLFRAEFAWFREAISSVNAWMILLEDLDPYYESTPHNVWLTD